MGGSAGDTHHAKAPHFQVVGEFTDVAGGDGVIGRSGEVSGQGREGPLPSTPHSARKEAPWRALNRFLEPPPMSGPAPTSTERRLAPPGAKTTRVPGAVPASTVAATRPLPTATLVTSVP